MTRFEAQTKAHFHFVKNGQTLFNSFPVTLDSHHIYASQVTPSGLDDTTFKHSSGTLSKSNVINIYRALIICQALR